jgi:ThiF family protein
MLTDPQIERYSRQILLREVGARGQTRLLAARVALAGSGRAAAAAALLIGRAGVGALDLADDVPPLPELSPECRARRWSDLAAAPLPDLTVDLAEGRAARAGRPAVLGAHDGRRVRVLALGGRPCAACVDPTHRPCADAPAANPLTAPVESALGALVAAEALRLLLGPASGGRASTLALDGGVPDVSEIAPSAGCPACRAG